VNTTYNLSQKPDRYNVEEPDQALRDLARRFNNRWIIGFRTPLPHQRQLLGGRVNVNFDLTQKPDPLQ
jgi:hypothetical protein